MTREAKPALEVVHYQVLFILRVMIVTGPAHDPPLMKNDPGVETLRRVIFPGFSHVGLFIIHTDGMGYPDAFPMLKRESADLRMGGFGKRTVMATETLPGIVVDGALLLEIQGTGMRLLYRNGMGVDAVAGEAALVTGKTKHLSHPFGPQKVRAVNRVAGTGVLAPGISVFSMGKMTGGANHSSPVQGIL